MPVSQNGWQINPAMTPLVVNGVSFGPCHDGNAHIVLEYVATRFDNEVERLVAGTCGCYNPRMIPGTNVWSNHASATAIDCNWQNHPLGRRGTFSITQVAAIRRILDSCHGAIRWGGDYHNSADEMHFEINADENTIRNLATELSNTGDAMSAADATEGFMIVLRDAANAALPDSDPNKKPTTQTGRNALVFLHRIIEGIAPKPTV